MTDKSEDEQIADQVDARIGSRRMIKKLKDQAPQISMMDGQVSELMRLVDVLSDSAAEAEVSLQVGSSMLNKHIKEHLLARAAVEAFARAAIAQPVQPVEGQRVPLTPAQYNQIPELCAILPSLYESIVRAIEAAHGIKETK